MFSPHELSARIKVLQRVKDFERAVERAFNALGKTIGNVYSQARSGNPNEWGRVTTLEATRMLDSRPNSPVLVIFAVHKHLMRRGDEFISQVHEHRMLHAFDVRPQAHLDVLRTVNAWIREKSPVLNSFFFKTGLLIDRSRKLVEESFDEPPSAPIRSAVTFTPDDMFIIKALQLFFDNPRTTQDNPFAIIVAYVIKAVGKYEGTVDPSVVLRFLTEIGAYTPWEDLSMRDRHFLQLTKPMTEDGTSDSSTQFGLSCGETLSPYVDPLDDVRHDFGSLPVYVLDDPSAEELDDGISAEPVLGEPGSTWLHVHIADPTALFPPEHTLSRHARRQAESIYAIHKTWRLLPDAVTLQSSLHRDPAGRPKRVLTFSCKVDSDGDISDCFVRAGLVRDVHPISYDDADLVLGLEELKVSFPFEELFPQLEGPRPSDPAALLPHKGNLELILQTTDRVVQRRNKDLPVFTVSRPRVTISLFPSRLPESDPDSTVPTLFRGFPALGYCVACDSGTNRGARKVVEECMKIAGRIASRFCRDRGIPMIRRALAEPSEGNQQLEILLKLRDEHNHLSLADFLKSGFVVPPARYTTEPAAHWALGIPDGEGYARVTSPLRRFIDLASHWQIKAALLPTSSTGGRLPFPEEDMKLIISQMKAAELVLKRTERNSEKYWSRLCIQRAMDKRKRLLSSGVELGPDPLRSIDAHISGRTQLQPRSMFHQTEVIIPSLGIMATLISHEPVKMQLGTIIKVNVKDLFNGSARQVFAELAD